MTWKPKKQDTLSASTIELFWEKWGTWISGAVALALAVWLVWVLVQKFYDNQASKVRQDLDRVSAEDAGAKMQLARLVHDHGTTSMGPSIQLKLAQVCCREGDYAAAEKALAGLSSNRHLSDVDRAAMDLTLAYAAQGQGNFDEARKRFKVVESDGLYVDEAKHMLDVLDRMSKGPSAPAPATPEAPKAPEAPKTPETPK